MHKLEIIIPQYNESENIISEALNSIKKQRGINFDQIGVTIVNDCSSTKLDKDFLESYSFDIKYLTNTKNTGPGLARQYGIDNSESSYITFMDADDYYYDENTLYIVLSCINDVSPKIIVTDFICEDQNGNTQIFDGIKNTRWLHGKFINRKYLIDNNIRFSNLFVYEDSYFTSCLMGANKLSSNELIHLSFPAYFWKHNNNSITRAKNFNTAYYDDYIKCLNLTLDFYLACNSYLLSLQPINSLIKAYITLNSSYFDGIDINPHLDKLKKYTNRIINQIKNISFLELKDMYNKNLKNLTSNKSDLICKATFKDFKKFYKQ